MAKISVSNWQGDCKTAYMNDFGFPKYSRSQKTGNIGASFVEHFVTSDLGFIYRPVHGEDDFGIDGCIDIVENGSVTGASIAVQIKCGDTYWNKQTSGGIHYCGDSKHINFYLNASTPVLLIVLNGDCSEGVWGLFDVNKTSETGSGWSLEIPFSNRLNDSCIDVWTEFAGPAMDFTEHVKTTWALDKLMASTKFKAFAIPKEEVVNLSFGYISSLLTRLSKTHDMLVGNRNSMEIYFPGYDDDDRELPQIPEVRAWVQRSLEVGVPWFYFLSTEAGIIGLRTLFFCACEITYIRLEGDRYRVEVPFEERMKWLDINFCNMNDFMNGKGLSMELNVEISDNINRALMNFLQEDGLPDEDVET